MGVAALEGICASLNDISRCVEIGLTDLEVDDVSALCLKPLGLGQDLEGGLGTKAPHPLG